MRNCRQHFIARNGARRAARVLQTARAAGGAGRHGGCATKQCYRACGRARRRARAYCHESNHASVAPNGGGRGTTTLDWRKPRMA
eukprot:1708148-Lingulodinium_polyedra.AAC.1